MRSDLEKGAIDKAIDKAFFYKVLGRNQLYIRSRLLFIPDALKILFVATTGDFESMDERVIILSAPYAAAKDGK